MTCGKAWFFRLLHPGAAARSSPDPPPARAELFNAAQMEAHGRLLSARHRLARRTGRDHLLDALAADEAGLRASCRVLNSGLQTARPIAPAGEWLLDNFYLIEEQVRTARRHLPRGYSRELPRLAEAGGVGRPRVYEIAREAIAHGDGRIDPEGLSRFVAAYQERTPLDLGELWAIPIMLRLALISNLHRLADQVADSALAMRRADEWADWMMGVAVHDPKSLVLVVADMARSNPPMTSAFVAELARRLLGQSAALALPLTWIEQRLAESGLTIENLVQSEAQAQAACQVSISNSIASLRLFAATDWHAFVEGLSDVERILREDPGASYRLMDAATRDAYRHVIERVARAAGLGESAVARKAVDLARRAQAAAVPADGSDPRILRTFHVGFYLVDDGLDTLHRSLEGPGTPLQVLAGLLRRRRLAVYLAAVALLPAVLMTWLGPLLLDGAAGPILGSAQALLALLCFTQLSLALVNWATSLLCQPRLLPRLDFSTGIPDHCRTAVVVPALLVDAPAIDALVEALEIRFLANRDPALCFILLTDHQDAPTAQCPEDAERLARARSGITRLNDRHGQASGGPFLLLHRERRWNPHEGCWMGEERKRGKLHALNALLRDPQAAAFDTIEGDRSALRDIRYVITLDADTGLPRDAARQCIGAMDHPLNRPCYDARLARVTAGYAILQPRVAVSLPSTFRSRYARVFGSEGGIDPYTRAISDVYQDVFGEGSFIGKGIYDVDAFELAMGARLPANRILSHDLLEGCYARSGLLSDVLLIEDCPSSYQSDCQRRHRWIRGDWQVASWALGRVPGSPGDPDRGTQPNRLSALSRWKILDNLRRSLGAPALTLWLILVWLLRADPVFWTALVLAILVLPVLLATLVDLCRRPAEQPFAAHALGALREGAARLQQVVLSLAWLPHEAALSLDAIVRTHWRLLVTHRQLLAWRASASADGGASPTLAATLRIMWPVPLLAAVLAVILAIRLPASLPAAAPILLLWLLAPWLSFASASRWQRPEAALEPEQRRFLGAIARRTWLFFETHVCAAENWLPPDNFQVHPSPVIAHRTSPTNIGLALLANLAAHDLGYLAGRRLLTRTAATLSTLRGLERYQGHFLNWYDTITLAALPPRYVSTVDSGNLVGHLLTLQSGLAELGLRSILPDRWRTGLHDTLDLCQEAIDLEGLELPSPLSAVRAELALLDAVPVDAPFAVVAGLRRLDSALHTLVDAVGRDAGAAAPGTAAAWALALHQQCGEILAELLWLLPWAGRVAPPACFAETLAGLRLPTLVQVARQDLPGLLRLDATPGSSDASDIAAWRAAVAADVAVGAQRAEAQLAEQDEIGREALRLADARFGFLYDPLRHLLAIGFDVGEHRRDASFYDMLASEARLASFLAIASGELPQSHWFALGRLLTRAGGKPVLLSWSGSMFEYLMPVLVMPSFEGTLLDSSCRAAVEGQIAYGAQCDVAWGISESGYNAVDIAMNYQYRAFGVPGMGLKPGLADDLVVAPYATALALMVAPERACRNLQRLAAEGTVAAFGFYEAIDHTPARQPRRQSSTVVRSFMAHHQGMILLAIDHVLLERPMQRRFGANPMIRATALLLQERVPQSAAPRQEAGEFIGLRTGAGLGTGQIQVIASPWTRQPVVQLLSNGRYHVMVSNAGGGYSRWKDLAVTRWQEDPTRDAAGSFCYLRDVATGALWSNTHQPVGRPTESYEAIFSEGRAEFRRSDFEYDCHTEIVVSPEDDIELRRLHLTNRSRSRRTIEVTSYAEVVLATPLSDALHPAFGKLFVQTEFDPTHGAILAMRRPRAATDAVPWAVHLIAVRGPHGRTSFETDRARFIGRGRTLADPQAFDGVQELSGTCGSVLDPVMAIRERIVLEPQQSVVIDIVTGVAGSRAAARLLAGKYQDRNLADRVFDLACTHSLVVLRQINATEADARLFCRLAAAVLYAEGTLRAEGATVMRNRRGQAGLWGYAISGDLPIVLVQIADPLNIELVRQMVQAHAYWRLKGVSVDLVIWNEDQAGYRQQLQDQILGLIASGIEAHILDKPGGIFPRRSEQMSDEERTLVRSVARAIVSDQRGSLDEQVRFRVHDDARALHAHLPRLRPSRAPRNDTAPAGLLPLLPALLFDNGTGGFLPDGSEYVITTGPGRGAPVPWCNVIANAGFGTVVSERGSACTWSENAQQFRLTPWANDPVGDPSGEVSYLRDEETGQFWSVTPQPTPGQGIYRTRHGFGYSVFEHVEGGILSELTVFVALDSAVKFSLLRVHNRSGRPRRLSATQYLEWVLGDLREKSAMHLVTETFAVGGALFARNAFNSDFPERTAFLDVDDPDRSYTADRAEFLGRNRHLSNPAAMGRARLSNTAGATLDPCGALQTVMDFAEDGEHTWVFRLGCGADLESARRLLAETRGLAAAQQALRAVRSFWQTTLGSVQIETPEPAVDVLANGWLVYQTLGCRYLARNAFYQSGGAFGFRDQLQDTMALLHAAPDLARAHLLRSAAEQFPQGDVLHWWHPGSGRGVRTRCSDDFLWLPLAACRYVEVTGDASVLQEQVPFIEGRTLAPGEEAYFDLPARTGATETLYLHCVRAIEHGLATGAHGLPLIGSGDWNDGMNTVGLVGHGESVWLGFFLHVVLSRFAELAAQQGDTAFAARCRGWALERAQALEAHGWDGDWYRRAYFDDGTPLGTATANECQIDAVAQSWAVLSGVAPLGRARQAMASLEARLVRREDGLIKLLDPPFDAGLPDPGYIRGYVPGVRENGGQYTHAAVWSVMAFAALGEADRAWELLRLINPVRHAETAAGVARYKVEPYVVAADVYAVAPHIGRGGWTWYTGSAGWFYRLIIESLLGLERKGDRLLLSPCLPREWPRCTLRYRYRSTTYVISLVRDATDRPNAEWHLDGRLLDAAALILLDDGVLHHLEVRLAAAQVSDGPPK